MSDCFARGKARFTDRSQEERMVAEAVCERRLQMAWTLNNVLLIVQLVVCVNMQINIAIDNQDRWAGASLSWLAIAALALLCISFIIPQCLRVGTLDVWYVCGTALVGLALSPFFTTYNQSIRMSRLLVGLYRIPATTVSTRPWLVVLCNLATAALMLARINLENHAVSGTCEQWDGVLNSSCMEALNFLLVSMVGVVLDRALRSQVQQDVQCRNTAAELSAASSLLHLTCDAVFELDEELRLAENCQQLSAMLLRDPISLKGTRFTDFMPTDDEATRTAEILKGSSSSDPSNTDFRAEAFHTRLVDSCSSKFRSEVFHVSYTRIDGRHWHLLGLRDFTDQGSLAGPNAVDSRHDRGDMQASHAPVTPTAQCPNPDDRGRALFLQIDMDALLVRGASIAVSRFAGQALDRIFGSLEIRFLTDVWQQVQVLAERRELKNKDWGFCLCFLI